MNFKQRAFGLIELLLVIIIGIIIYFTCFHSPYGRRNPFDDNAKIQTHQEIIDEKLMGIEETKTLKQRIEKNLEESN